MSFWADRRKRKITVWIGAIVLVLALIIGACAIYLSDYYRADRAAIAAFPSMSAVQSYALSDSKTVFDADNAKTGLIFYPGGKVEHTAYQPLMAALAERGILCVLVEMPFRLAVFDVDAADGVRAQFPDIEHWYIGGHSLGGSMAASYLADHTDEFDGLILLGAYSTADLSKSDLKVLSLYGSEDLVMNRKKYASNRANLPDDMTECIIEGGCHAYFGMYGAQSGDGVPRISNEEQIVFTAEQIVNMTEDGQEESQ